MRQLLFVFSLTICFTACQKQYDKVIEADLYFKLIDFQRFFDAPDSVIIGIENNVMFANRDTLNVHEKKLFELFKYMIDKNLLREPFIRLRFDNGDIKMVFLDKSLYDQFLEYKWTELSQENKKIRVKAEVRELQFDTLTAYQVTRLISIKKVDGKTYWTK